MPQKYFDDQFDDEEVLFVFRKHPIVMRRGLIFASLATVLGTVPAVFNPSLTVYFTGLAVGMGVGMLIMFPSWLSWYFSLFIVTDQRFIQITQKGLFNRSVVDMGLNQIQMVNYQVAGFSQTLLGFGTIMMQTFVGDLVIHNIHHPAKIQKRLLEVLRTNGSAAEPHPAQSVDQEEEKEQQYETEG